jgi:hypothetical protein
LAQETQHLVAPGVGKDEVRIGLDVRHQPVLEGAHAEVPVALLQQLHRAMALRTAAIHQVLLRVEALAGHAVLAFIIRGVKMAAIVQALQHGLHHSHMPGIRGADVMAVVNVQARPQITEAHAHAVAQLFWGDACALGGLQHLLAMLVVTGQEESLAPQQTVEAREDIGQHRGVGVAQMQIGVHIVDRRGDVVRLHLPSCGTILDPLKRPAMWRAACPPDPLHRQA